MSQTLCLIELLELKMVNVIKKLDVIVAIAGLIVCEPHCQYGDAYDSIAQESREEIR